jgi:GH15 family glucan-1,4-alpha-glucosidase
VVAFADFVATHWHHPDAGIWEGRGEPSHHTHSKVMACLALDRALQMAARHPVSLRRARAWSSARSAIAQLVQRRGFDEAAGSYTRTWTDTTSIPPCSSCR